LNDQNFRVPPALTVACPRNDEWTFNDVRYLYLEVRRVVDTVKDTSYIAYSSKSLSIVACGQKICLAAKITP